MGADVAERAARAGALRIDPPLGLLVAGGLGRPAQPVLRIFDLDEADLPEFAAARHLQPYQRETLLREAQAADRQADWWLTGAIEAA